MFSYFSEVVVYNIQNLLPVSNIFFSVSIIEFEFQTFSNKKVCTVFRNVLLLDIFLIFKLMKYSLFVIRNSLTRKFISFLYLSRLVSYLVSLNQFLSLNLVIFIFLRDFAMNGLWLTRKLYFLIGAELSNVSRKMF